MATIPVYHEEEDKEYTVFVDLKFDTLYDGTGEQRFYLMVYTDMLKVSGAAFGRYAIRDLVDTPTGFGTASTFTELIEDYIEYFKTGAELGQSSSSSSQQYSSSSSSSLSSESSSSEQYSSSSSSSNSSSSSSSSELYSESSSSSSSNSSESSSSSSSVGESSSSSS